MPRSLGANLLHAQNSPLYGLGRVPEPDFPVQAPDFATASRIAFTYVLNVLKYKDFELRIVGS